ncbi:15699_t:CDS:2, partial [Gigaspora margarita]
QLKEWKNEENEEESFYHLFVEFFATSEKQHCWQIELNNLQQHRNEMVDIYVKNLIFVAVSEPKNLEEAIISARRVKQIALNYTALNDKCPREFHGENRGKNEKGQDKYQEFKKDITCYNCGETGHISQNCMSEKVPKKKSEEKVKPATML